MRQIGRELECEDHVVELKPIPQVGTQRCIGSQLQQASVVVGDMQLAGRAQHAAAFHAPQLAHTDLEGFAVFARRQFRPDDGQWHANADTGIGRPADDLQRAVGRVLAGIDAADTQAVGTGVLLGGEDLGHHDATEGRRHGTLIFDLHATHGQQVGQLLGGQRRRCV